MAKPDYLTSKNVPYVTEEIRVGVRKYLPSGHDQKLTAADVAKFVSKTRTRPNVRLAVLATLRSHSLNGSEMPLAAFALLVSTGAIWLALASSPAPGSWIAAITLFVGVIIVSRWAAAAHIRKITATVWLAAYEDELRIDRP